ncbi:MAG TPA: lycopene cyclase domain-containing protein [Acidimicrobiales bacterium]|nr:lycopene cyclase domain-containing protein [Acidimicrobiales bacterium]
MDRFQYLLVMAACVVGTLPLELALGARVWRQPLRLAAAVMPGVVVFALWDLAAIAQRHWSFNSRYVTGWELPGHLPVEEVVFFVVVPVCALLTFNVVNRVLGRSRKGG